MDDLRFARAHGVALAFAVAIAGLAIPVGSARASVADSVPNRTYVTNGPVETVVRSGNTIYIGGRFSRLGPRTGPGVEFGLDGSENVGLPEVTGGDGTVKAVVADGSGGWFIGGLFTRVGGVARNNLAHIRADHSVDPTFNPDANGGVHAVVLSGSTVYAAGVFSSIGGQVRNRIAALRVADGSATAFNPDANAAVEALAVSGSVVYAGGRFTTIGGQPRNNIAALNALDGAAVLTFNPTSDGIVLALAVSGATLYVGGYFKVIGGQPRSNIAALNAGGPLDGTAIPAFDPNAANGTCAACGGVTALAMSPSGSTVYAGGMFTIIGGQNRRYLAALAAADGKATAFNPNPNSNILGLAISGDGSTVYVAGGFNSPDGLPSIGGKARDYIAAVDAVDGTANGFDPPAPNAATMSIGVSDSAVYVGGAFSSIGGVVRNGIAAIDATDGTATGFDPDVRFGASSANVYALAISGSTLYAGGFFTSVGGQPRNYIAAINTADGTPTDWNPGASSIVETLAISGSTLYAGGWFSTIGGQPRSAIAALSLSDGTPTAFDPGANSGVAEIVLSGALVYAAGYFTVIGGQTRNKLAALNAADGSATPWNPDATATANVLAIAVSGSTVYAGGNFVTIGGQARKNLAALNVSDGTATAFDPQASDGVFAVAVSASTVYAAGFFSTIGGQTRHLVAELDPIDGSATAFDPGADPGFGAFALTVAHDGTLYVGGSFRTFDRAFQQGIASFAAPPMNQVPVARLAAQPTAGVAPLTVAFDASTSSDPDAADTIANYTFDFGDGSPTATQPGASISHTYTTPGTHNGSVTVTDSRGLQSANAASVPIQVIPSGPSISTPEQGAALNASSVTIVGTSDPNVTVSISEGGTELGPVAADGAGDFSLTRTFADGAHTITATAIDASGNTGTPSAPRTFSVDTVAPGVPTIASPVEGATLTDSFVAVSGTAEPGADVTLTEGARTVAVARADASGSWSAGAGFANGAHALVAVARDTAGNAGIPSAPRTFTIDDVFAPAAPAIVTPAESATVDAATVIIDGTSEPGVVVVVREAATVLATTSANAAGVWRAALFGVAPGAHAIAASATDAAGNAGPSSAQRAFTVVDGATGLRITGPGPGSIQPGYVAFTGAGATPGVAVALSEGSVSLGTVMPSSEGSWSVGVTLATGAHTVVATSAGIAPSATRSFTVDADAPAVQVTTAPQTIFLPGETVRISGIASDNLSVVAVTVTYLDTFNREVSRHAAVCACAPGAAHVTWTSEPTLPSGSYTAIAQGVDEAGNPSATRTTSFFTL